MSFKPVSAHLRASMGCLVVVFSLLMSSNYCEGQGTSSSSIGPLVGGGDRALRGRFPYMCSLRTRVKEKHACGGFVIDKEWIMTAAHCLDPNEPRSVGMTPIVYCNIYEREAQTNSKKFTPSRCFLHHMWDGNTFNGHDIALCRLERSVAVAIPRLANIGDNFAKGVALSVLGWGSTSPTSDFAEVLQIGFPLLYYATDSCNITEGYAGRIKDSMICAGRGTPSTCSGDSGGPLFVRHDPENRDKDGDPRFDLIAGITSFGDTDCEEDLPGVYTKVSCYRTWINCIMQGTSQDCSVHSPCDEGSPSCSGASSSSTINEADALERIRTAISSDNSETVRGILCEGLSANAIYGNDDDSLLIVAAESGAIESAKILLQNGATVDYENSKGQAALSRAAALGSTSVAQLLINSDGSIETKSNAGWTPLINAARYNHLGVAKILLDNGADIENKDNQRWTSLHHAAEGDSVEVAKELMSRGANVNSKERWEWTPLHIAVQGNFIDLVKELIANGARVASRERKNWTPLHFAAQGNFVAIVKVLIDAGAFVDSKTDDGSTPLHISARKNSLAVAKELIASGALVNSRDDDEWTPLHVAVQYGSAEVAEELIDNGADIQATINVGVTPLHIASYRGYVRLVNILIDGNAVVDAVDDAGRSALYWAASLGHLSVVRVLVDNGASKTLTDQAGDTSFDVICDENIVVEPCSENVKTTLRQLLRP